MSLLDTHAETYPDQPERRDAYLAHLARERLLRETEATESQPVKKTVKPTES